MPRAASPAREGACAPQTGSLSHVLLCREQLLEAAIVSDWVPDRIDLQSRDGNGFTGRDRKKFSQVFYGLIGSAGLRLNLSQTGEVTGTKYRILLRRQKLDRFAGDFDCVGLAVQGELNPA